MTETASSEPSGGLLCSTPSARRPWRVEAASAIKGATVWSDAGMQIAETGNAEFDLQHAHLIAAAPELADALRELHDFADLSSNYRHTDRSMEAFEKAAELLKRVGA